VSVKLSRGKPVPNARRESQEGTQYFRKSFLYGVLGGKQSPSHGKKNLCSRGRGGDSRLDRTCLGFQESAGREMWK